MSRCSWTKPFVVVVLLSGLFGGIAQAREKKDGALTGRILLKLNEALSQDIETSASTKASFEKRYKSRSLRPVYDDVVVKPGLSRSKAFERMSRDVEQRFSDRQRRADGDVPTPNLALTYMMDLAEGDDVEARVRDLTSDPQIVWAEAERLCKVYAADPDPDDTYYVEEQPFLSYPYLWPLYPNHMNARNAWEVSKGTGVVIAVVDTGLWVGHPDIAQNVWVNAGEIPNNRIDDDRNGYVDDVNGWNFVGPNSFSPTQSENVYDVQGHGTHVSGIAAAVGYNAKGVIGVAYKAKVMPVRVLDDEGYGADREIAFGIRYAADRGAHVINLSLGRFGQSNTMEEALQYARSKGVVITAAAGNDRANLDVTPNTPAGSPNVLTISGSDVYQNYYTRTNYGSKVDVAAPAVDILSLNSPNSQIGRECPNCVLSGDYLFLTGTSMATPQVSGVAALLLAQNPRLSVNQVRQIIRQTADDRGATGFDPYFGHGRVNAYKALQFAAPPVVKLTSPAAFEDLPNVVNVQGIAGGPGFRNYQLEYAAGTSSTFTPIGPLVTVPVNSTGTLGAWDTTSLPAGTYTLQLRVTDLMNRVWTEQVASLAREAGVSRLSSVISQQEQPALSDTRAAWVDYRDPSGRSAIYVYDFATKQEKRIDPTSTGSQVSPALFGNLLVYLDNRAGNWDLYSYDFRTQTVSGGLSTPDDENDPFLDDHWMVYERAGKIYLVNRINSTERLISSEGYNKKPSISQRRVVWSRQEGPDLGIYLYDMDVAPQKERLISRGNITTESPRIHKDWVVWEDSRSGQWQTYVLNLTQSTTTAKPIGTASSATRGQQHWPALWDNRVVLTDYPNGSALGVLMEYNLVTGSSKRISQGTGFQHHAAIYNSRTLWMDERRATPLIYLAILGADTEAPIVDFVSELPAEYWRNSVTVEARAVDNLAVQKVRFKLNNQVYAEKTTPPYTFTFNTLLIPNNTYALKVEAVDAAGNVGLKGARIVIYNVNRFGAEAGLAPGFALDLDHVRVFPSPWRADKGHTTLMFDTLTENSTVKIFTLSGKHVRTLTHSTGEAPWDLKNDAGDPVASGVYLYLIEDRQDRRARGKFAVIR